MRTLYIVRAIMFFLITLVFQSAFAYSNSSNFFKIKGKDIVDPDGNTVILRGIGLGGWLLPEDYMLHISSSSPTAIRNMIIDLIDPVDTDKFYKIYEKNYVAEKDIEQIAKWGFNSIRLPFHYKRFYDPDKEVFREDGFQLLNVFLDWCKAKGLYIIMDMHAAPGGQNPAGHSDPSNPPSFWAEPANQDLAIKIWKEIARRYANEPQIIRYDFINEPVLPEGHKNDELRSFYERLTNAIREVDSSHILFIEGNNWATDFNLLTIGASSLRARKIRHL